MQVKPTAGDTAALPLVANRPGVTILEMAIEPARAEPEAGWAATTAGGTAAAYDLALAALRSSREAGAVSVEIMKTLEDLPTALDAVDAAAAHAQAEAEALLAVSGRLTRLAQRLHDAASALRPPPSQRRAALVEDLRSFKAQHEALLAHTETRLEGGGRLSARQVMAAGACGLGEGLRARFEACYGPHPGFEALREPHAAFHRGLAGILFAQQQRQGDAEQRLREALKQHAAALGKIVDGLCADLMGGGAGANAERATSASPDFENTARQATRANARAVGGQ